MRRADPWVRKLRSQVKVLTYNNNVIAVKLSLTTARTVAGGSA
jgi:hypothetical protein